MTVEYLSVELKTVADFHAGEIEGIAAVFGGSPDRVRDVIAPGAFTRTLAAHRAAGTMPALLLHHDPKRVAGAWSEMVETTEGLHCKGKLALGTRDGDEAHALARANALRFLSIGYRTVRATRLPGGVRRLDEIDLVEISLTATPAHPRAVLHSVKSFPPAAGAATNSTGEHMSEHDEGAAPENGADETKALVADLETKMTGAISAALSPIATRLDAVERVLRRPGAPAPETKDGASPEFKAFTDYLRNGAAALGMEIKGLRAADDESGGYLAPAEFVAMIDKNLVQFSPVRGLALVANTARGEAQVPRRTGRPTARWVEDEEERPETETKYGIGRYPVKELACYIDVPLSLLEDAAVDIAAEISMDAAEEFGFAEGQAFVNGSGIGRPMGFMTDTEIGFTKSGHASQLTADGLIDLFHAIPAGYRSNLTWAMNAKTLGAARKLKDGDGNYLVMVGGIANAPATTLLGRPIVEFPDMPDIGAGTYPVIAGDFRSGYRVFDRTGFSVLRDDYTQRTKGKVRFHFRKRVAGGVRKAEALRKLQIAA